MKMISLSVAPCKYEDYFDLLLLKFKKHIYAWLQP